VTLETVGAPPPTSLAQTARPPIRRRGLLIAITCLVGYLVSLDPTTISVANPRIADSLHATLAGTQWITTAFLLSYTVLLIGGGTLADRFGRTRVLLAGVVCFTFGLALATVAAGVTELVVARLFVGAGAAAMQPAAIAAFGTAFSPARAPSAMGIWIGAAMLGSATAPIAAGWLLSIGSWRLIFGVLAVVSALVAVVLWTRLRDADRGSPAIALHVARNVVIGVGLAALVWGLIRAGARGWGSPQALVPSLLGAAVLLCVLWRLRPSSTAPGQGGFASASIGSVLLVIVLATLGYIATVFLLGIYLQRIGGASPLQTGLRLVPFLGVAAIVSPIAGRLTAVLGERPVLLSSFAFELTGLIWLSRLGVRSSYDAVWPPLVLMGLSISTLTPASLSLLMRSGAPERSGLLGALFGGSSQFGGVLSVAVMGSVIASTVAGRFERLLSAANVSLTLAASGSARLAQGLAPTPASASAHALRVIDLSARRAFVGSMDLAFACSAVGAVLALCIALALAWHMRRPRTARGG